MKNKTKETEAQKIARLKAARLKYEASHPNPKPIYDYHRTLGLYDEMPFGKHKGKTIMQVMDDDLDWITWALENIKTFELSPPAEDEYNARFNRGRPYGRHR